MENIIFINLMKNMILLTLKDKEVADIYYKSIYNFKKFLLVSISSYCLIVLNMIILYVVEVNRNKIMVKDIEKFLLILEGILILLFCLWNIFIDEQKREKYFYPVYVIISSISLFNVYFQPQVTKEALTCYSNDYLVTQLFPYYQLFLILAFIFFVENNFIIHFVNLNLGLSLAVAFSISADFKKFLPLLFCYLGGFIFIFLVYCVNRRHLISFLLYRNALTELEKKKSFLDNLNSGFVTVDQKGCDYNLKVKEYLDTYTYRMSEPLPNLNPKPDRTNTQFSFQHNDSVSILCNNYTKDTNFAIKNLLFADYSEYSLAMDSRLKQILQRTHKSSPIENKEEKEIFFDVMIKDLLNLMKNEEIYQSYIYIGNKVINKGGVNNILSEKANYLCRDSSTTLRIYFRYNIISSSLEFFLYNISSVLEIENLKASNKYKKLFLNKFSHEFKNPLLNIVQLVSDLKKKMRDLNGSSISGNNSKIHYNQVKSRFKKDSQKSIPDLSAKSKFHSFSSLTNFSELKYIKNLTRYLISLISDFDFISNPESDIHKNKRKECKTRSNLDQSLCEQSNFKLSKVIKQCLSVLQTKIELSGKKINLFFSIDKNIPEEINSDCRKLKQILSNLLSNAFKFTSMGEISITVSKDLEKNDMINFEIRDTGMGFRNDILSMIQSGNTHNLFGNINSGGNIYGCGLGLELVEKMISIIGANFKISSKIDEGSTIYFSIYHLAGSPTKILIDKQLKSARSFIPSNKIKINELLDNSTRSGIHKINRNKKKRRSISSKNNSKKFIGFNTMKESISKYENDNEQNNKSSPGHLKQIRRNRKFSKFKIRDNKEIQVQLEYDYTSGGYQKDKVKETKIEIVDCQDNSNPLLSENSQEDKTMIYDKIMSLNDEIKDEINLNNSLNIDQESSINSKTAKLNYSYTLGAILKNEDVCLSLDQEKARAENYNTKGYLSGPIEVEKMKKIRILLVDDERFIRTSESQQINKYFKNKPEYNFEITECSDGAECLYAIYKGIQEGIKYDYIITDESMNFMRGTRIIEILNSLIEEKVMYSIKKFMVTSYEPWAIINNYGNIFDGILTKPLSFENISKIFDQI